MQEPYLSQFRHLIREGAGTLDIQDGQTGSSYTIAAAADERLIEREVARVALHRDSICRLLERHVGACQRVLDLGCGTGATTVAVGLSDALAVREVIGVDPNASSIRAARVRALGYGLAPPRVVFQDIAAGATLPFESDTFDLTLCVSVIEYLGTAAARVDLAREMLRVTRPCGQVCLVTPNPYRLRDFHTHRLFGDFRRVEGFPWASRPRELREMFGDNPVRFLRGEQLEHGLARRGAPGASMFRHAGFLAHLLPWQKLLVRKVPAVR